MNPGRAAPTVLVLSGVDPSGGAGLVADVRALAFLGVYAGAVPTALTVQTTRGVERVVPVPVSLFVRMAARAFEDLRPRAVKIGLLPGGAHADALGRLLARHPAVPCVLDPVLVATSGRRLFPNAALPSLFRLLGRVTVLTPNRHEAEVLSGLPVDDAAGQSRAALVLRSRGPRLVVVKGGHVAGRLAVDVAFDGRRLKRFEAPRVEIPGGAHGLGCFFSSTLAGGLAGGLEPMAAVERVHRETRRLLAGGLLRPGGGRAVPFPFRVSGRSPSKARRSGPPRGA